MSSNIGKKIDVCILTTNKYKELYLLFASLSAQTVTPNKIILLNTVDASSGENDNYEIAEIKDKVTNILKNIELVEIKIDKKDFSHGSTRNTGAKESNANYIIYMTDDSLPCDNTLVERLCDGINKNIALKVKYETIVAASYARQIASKNATFIEKKVREFNYKNESYESNLLTAKQKGIKNIFLSNVCAIYDLNILRSLGYFEENVDFNEDTLFADKAIKNGYSIVYNADAQVYHSHNFSFKEQYKRNILIGKSHATNPQVFGAFKAEGEGSKLVIYVVKECLKRFKFISLISFLIECVCRYLGYRKGRKIKTSL